MGVKMEGNNPNEVTFVVSRNKKPWYGKEYDDWLKRYLAIEKNAPRYLGTTIIIIPFDL
jgi:uncharacterized protein